MKPLFHFFSLHFISPPPPSHLISRSRRVHRRRYIPGGPSQLELDVIIGVFSGKKRVSREDLGRSFFFRSRVAWNRKANNGFVERFSFDILEIAGFSLRSKRERKKLQFPFLARFSQSRGNYETVNASLVSGIYPSRFLEISFQKFLRNLCNADHVSHSFISQIPSAERQF